MYMTRVSIAEIQDKILLKGLKPFWIWLLVCSVLLFIVWLVPYDSIALPAMAMLMIGFPLCIPIYIICYKRTAPYRNPVYKRTTLTFDVVDRKVYMNGIEVDVTMNADGQFVINKNFIESYAVKKSDTLEFLEFLETNGIPFWEATPEIMNELRGNNVDGD